MKTVSVVLASVVLLCACALAQGGVPEAGADAMYFQRPVPGPAPGEPQADVVFHTQRLGDGKVGGGFIAMIDDAKPVTGAPYTATATTETTQVLADGNRIVNKTTAFLARDSQGRTRREESLGGLGPLAVNGPKTVFINDPVAKTSYALNLNNQSAQVLKAGRVGTGASMAVGMGGGKHTAMISGPVISERRLEFSDGPNAGVEQRIVVMNPAGDAGQVKTESLGTQVIEGVTAEGKRVTRTIPAGQIGNERPLEVTSEVWTSPDLQMMILSKRNDPRFGETVYRLTDIKRAEPDPSLFAVPGNFTVTNPAK